jgi:hypothetical protein
MIAFPITGTLEYLLAPVAADDGGWNRVQNIHGRGHRLHNVAGRTVRSDRPERQPATGEQLGWSHCLVCERTLGIPQVIA